MTAPERKTLRGPLKQPDFLPLTRREMKLLGWEEIDVLLVTGDAYVDHPAFGPALLGRWLVEHGFRVGLAAQPDWRHPESLTGLGRPRLMVGVTAGALDSMVAPLHCFSKKAFRRRVHARGRVRGSTQSGRPGLCQLGPPGFSRPADSLGGH